MDIIGTIPEKEVKISAIPVNLYSVEFTAYNYVGHFCKFNYGYDDLTETDCHLVVYNLYNETKYYFTKNTRFPRAAYLEAKANIHDDIEIIKLNRYRLVKEWRNEFIQPFIPELKYFNQTYLKAKNI